MKKLLVLCLLLAAFVNTNSQTYNSAVVNQSDGNNTTVLTNEIDSITYSNLNTQDIWTKDSIYSIPLSSINSTTFEKFDLPGVLVKSENIGDWSEMRLATDGSLMMIKDAEGKEYPEDLVMILPSEDLGVLYSYAKFDENGMPKSVTINDCVILIDAYYDNYVDLTIAYNDTIAYSIDSLSFDNSNSRSYAPRRSWSENNWQRNLAGIVELASGAAGVVGGALLVAGSVVSEGGTFGASTPISIPGILAGSATIGGGVSTFRSGWDKLFTPGENRSNIGENIYYQGAGELIANGPQNAYVPEKYFAYMKDPNYSSQLSKAGWINFFVGLSAGLLDNLYGRTVTWEDIRQYYQGKVITGLNKDITTNSVLVRGYIYPSITRSLLDGSKVENEYGIVVYSTIDGKERYIQKETNGDGGMIEYVFSNLKPATTYNYVTYYADKTNGISLLGETKSFRTLSVPVAQIEQISAESKGFEKVTFKANVKLDAVDKGIEGTVAYGFGIYRDGERVYEYTIDNFDEVKEIEIDCESSNLTLDWENFEASTEGHWTIAVSVQFDYEGAHFITFFTDEMQDVVLTYNQKPTLTFTSASLGGTEVYTDDDGEPSYCSTEINANYTATGTFWANTADLVIIQGTAEDNVGYWDVMYDGNQPFTAYYQYPYAGDNLLCAFRFDFLLSNGNRVPSTNAVQVYGSPTVTNISIISANARASEPANAPAMKTYGKQGFKPRLVLKNE